MPWHLYIAETPTQKYYVGITTNIKRRLKAHNEGQGAQLAKGEGPFTLRYTSPPLPDQSTARRLEMKLKKWPRHQKTQLITLQIPLPTLIDKEP